MSSMLKNLTLFFELFDSVDSTGRTKVLSQLGDIVNNRPNVLQLNPIDVIMICTTLRKQAEPNMMCQPIEFPREKQKIESVVQWIQQHNYIPRLGRYWAVLNVIAQLVWTGIDSTQQSITINSIRSIVKQRDRDYASAFVFTVNCLFDCKMETLLKLPNANLTAVEQQMSSEQASVNIPPPVVIARDTTAMSSLSSPNSTTFASPNSNSNSNSSSKKQKKPINPDHQPYAELLAEQEANLAKEGDEKRVTVQTIRPSSASCVFQVQPMSSFLQHKLKNLTVEFRRINDSSHSRFVNQPKTKHIIYDPMAQPLQSIPMERIPNNASARQLISWLSTMLFLVETTDHLVFWYNEHCSADEFIYLRVSFILLLLDRYESANRSEVLAAAASRHTGQKMFDSFDSVFQSINSLLQCTHVPLPHYFQPINDSHWHWLYFEIDQSFGGTRPNYLVSSLNTTAAFCVEADFLHAEPCCLKYRYILLCCLRFQLWQAWKQTWTFGGIDEKAELYIPDPCGQFNTMENKKQFPPCTMHIRTPTMISHICSYGAMGRLVIEEFLAHQKQIPSFMRTFDQGDWLNSDFEYQAGQLFQQPSSNNNNNNNNNKSTGSRMITNKKKRKAQEEAIQVPVVNKKPTIDQQAKPKNNSNDKNTNNSNNKKMKDIMNQSTQKIKFQVQHWREAVEFDPATILLKATTIVSPNLKANKPIDLVLLETSAFKSQLLDWFNTKSLECKTPEEFSLLRKQFYDSEYDSQRYILTDEQIDSIYQQFPQQSNNNNNTKNDKAMIRCKTVMSYKLFLSVIKRTSTNK